MQIKSQKNQNVLILGGGPAGLYTALKLLEAVEDSRVVIFEKRETIDRPHVINSAFEPIDLLPEEIKRQLWPDPQIYQNIFGDHDKIEPGFWPYTEVKHLALFQIGEFQKLLKKYLETNFSDRFIYKILKEFSVNDLENIVDQFDLVVITAGNCQFAKDLRKTIGIHDLHVQMIPEIDTRAMNLIYTSDSKEPFERDGELLTKAQYRTFGITYSHSNDSKNHVQLYTFPAGNLRKIFEVMPESMKSTAYYPYSKLTFDGKLCNGSDLTDEEKKWFEDYWKAISEFFERFKINRPSCDQIQVFAAERMEYYYEKAGGKLLNTPILYIGDACGATDFKLGLGLGRAVLTSLNLTRHIAKHKSVSFEDIVDLHNSYWKNVVDTEFNQRNPSLTGSPEMTYKYFMKGRKVEGTVIGDEHKEEFLMEIKKIQQLKAISMKQAAVDEPIFSVIRNAGG